MPAEKTKKQGRPEGSGNRDYGQSVVVVSKCPNPECGSTERSEYTSRSELEFNGIDPLGQPYNLIVWRACQCKTCGQWRRDKSYETKKDNGEPII